MQAFIVALARIAPVLALTINVGTAMAQEPQTEPDYVTRAEGYADEAYDANAKKEYARAIALYQKAFDTAPGADILYNIARIYDTGIRDPELAMRFYRRYLADPGASPERIEKANERLQALRTAETATAARNAAGAPARSPGAAPARPHARDATGPADEVPYWSAERGAAVTAGALGVIGLGVGTAFTLSAIARNRDAEADCDGDICRTQRGVDAAQSALRQARVATVALSAGGVLAVAGGVLWLVSPSPDAQPRDTLGGIRWTPMAASSGVGVEISGRF
jgi:tetratricopeptide (TPR) repeat protein